MTDNNRKRRPISRLPQHSRSWREAAPDTYVLAQQHRQDRGDPLGTLILPEYRMGIATREAAELLRSRCLDVAGAAPADAIHIYGRNEMVDRHNRRFIDALPGELVTVEAFTSGTYVDSYAKDLLVPRTLRVKVGSKIMILVNAPGGDLGYANGDTGELLDIDNEHALVLLDRNLAVVRVGYASWSKSPQMMDRWARRKNRYTLADHLDHFHSGKTNASSVTQLPIRPSYGITLWKAQGLTLNKILLDLRGCDHVTQSAWYVGMSRVRKLNDLWLASMPPKPRLNPEIAALIGERNHD